jgi:5-methylcytosine-specific restriction endonuclease McrA
MPTLFKPKKQSTYKKNTANHRQRNAVYQTEMWKQMRHSQLTKEPLCCMCLANGRTKAASDVHHWIWLSEDYTLAFEPNNLVSVCSSCHGAIHSKTNAIKQGHVYKEIDKQIRDKLYGEEKDYGV